MPRLRYGIWLAVALATACAEIEFGAPTGGAHAGGAGGGPTAGADSGGGGSAPTGEQCLNGVDDDDDGLADCADDDCAAVACVSLPPEWVGPVELRADDSPCDGAFSLGIASLKTSVEAPPASCGCACAGGTQSCTTATLAFFANSSCAFASTTESLAQAQCEGLTGLLGATAYRVTPQGAAACTVGVDEAIAPPTFNARRLCGLPAASAGCSDGTCVPSSGSCVYASGNAVCPTGFGTAFTGSAGLIDSRACALGSCSCGGAVGGCDFSVELYDGGSCQGGPIDSTTSTQCQQLMFSNGEYSALFTSADGAFSCPTNGAPAATGSVTLSEPITVCCAL